MYKSVLIWLGDLNYRLDLPYSDVKQKIVDKELDGLLEHDQVYLIKLDFILLI